MCVHTYMHVCVCGVHKEMLILDPEGSLKKDSHWHATNLI